MCKLVVLTSWLIVACVWRANAAENSIDTSSSRNSEVGQGVQILGRIVRQYLDSQPEDVLLGNGVHLVSTQGANEARAVDDKSGGVLGALQNYLEQHELRIRLPELMPGEAFGRAFKDALDDVEDKGTETGRKGGGGGGGGGGKGGGMGGILVMGLMMGKMMAALGLGGVGLLAMKALMVSALALMLSTIIGLKKLVHSGHDEGGHHVIHAGGGGHGHEYRRKRDAAIDMAYNGWSAFRPIS